MQRICHFRLGDDMQCVSESSWIPRAVEIQEVKIECLVSRRILLVDDHELIRCGLRSLYAEIDGVPVAWLEAASLEEALEVYARHEPVDAVLLDLNLHDSKGLQGLRRFVQCHPEARVAVFSGTQDEFVVRQARALGAVAYLHKGAVMQDMRRTLGALLQTRSDKREGAVCAAGALFPKFTGSTLYERVSELGPRHLEILELVLSGCANQEISQCMSLSLGTVKNYVSALLLALDVKSRSHLISLFR
ncbi:response regulator transcription factor [Azohydromonas lata]|uniref:Response regulator transcription factor n=1 Tax=Azohydromonas lata TaxID=45677 RepID=A0ABU5IMB5_9BURK|nr:response regulator transcription factor [Azohydromonas lata]MDZ5460046.1 response regulator transcription factor [Azohydromonas lata]